MNRQTLLKTLPSFTTRKYTTNETLTADPLVQVLFTFNPIIAAFLSSDLLCRITFVDSFKLFSILLSPLWLSVGSIQDPEKNLDNYIRRVYASIDKIRMLKHRSNSHWYGLHDH